jgi:predicted dehydrogenase
MMPCNQPAPLKTGLLGYGQHARCALAPALDRHCEFELTTIYDPNPQARALAAEANCPLAASEEEFFGSGLDAVVVASPNFLHARHCLEAIRRGIHVFCEKPLTLDLAEATAVAQAADEAAVVGHVNFGLPFNESFRTVRFLTAEHLGRVHHFWIRTSRGFGNWLGGARHDAVHGPAESGGWTRHHMCHALAAAMVLSGQRIVSVLGRLQRSTPDCPSEELVHVFLEFEDGSSAYLNDGTTIGQFHDLGVMAERGDLRLVDGVCTVAEQGDPTADGRPGGLARREWKQEVPTRFSEKDTAHMLGLFAGAIRGEDVEGFPFLRAVEQIAVLDALLASAKSGTNVHPLLPSTFSAP